MENRIFFPQTALDQWLHDGSAELREGQLTVAGGRRFHVVEALRVLQEVSGIGDSRDLVGRVKARDQLAEAGAEIVETSMIIGECAYDVEPGWVGVAVGTFGEYLAAAEGDAARARDAPGTDEELLSRLAGV